MVGVYAGYLQKNFYFLKAKPDYAVVRIYDGLVVAVRYDPVKREFMREYVAMKLGDDDLKELDLVRKVLREPRVPLGCDHCLFPFGERAAP